MVFTAFRGAWGRGAEFDIANYTERARFRFTTQHGLDLYQIRFNDSVIQVTRKRFGVNFNNAAEVLIHACNLGRSITHLDQIKQTLSQVCG